MATVHNNNCLTCSSSHINQRKIINIVLNQELNPFICRQGCRDYDTTVTIRNYREAILPCKNYKPKKSR